MQGLAEKSSPEAVSLRWQKRREEQRQTVFKNRVLRKILGPKGTGENCVMRSFMICTQHQILR